MSKSRNHALQRTAPRVTLAAADRPAACAHPAPATFPQPARHAPQSLSLGSFGDAVRTYSFGHLPPILSAGSQLPLTATPNHAFGDAMCLPVNKSHTIPVQATLSVVRRATTDDAAAIECLYRELVSDPLIRVLPEQVAKLSESSTSFLLVAETDSAVCATALLTICLDAMYRTQPFGVIENVIVTQAMRGRGFGQLLLAHVEQLASDHHCTKLMLLSSQSRDTAHSFFRRCGFTSDTKHAFVKYRRQYAVR